MGDFSRTTFDRLKHYVGVRLQQGVPLVDADWNELEDIRRYELQAFLKWFVGDGVPAGNDGFRVAPLAGGGIGTIRLASAGAGPGRTSVTVDVGASTAAAALGFFAANRTTSRTGSTPAMLTGDAAAPFALSTGMTLVVSADGAGPETVTFAAASFANIGAATAAEVVTAVNASLTRAVASAGTGDDFTVMGGDGTPEGAGRCLVDGRDAVAESRLTYRSQPLFNNAALAALWDVPVVPPLAAPSSGNRDDLVYLDVWEREVTAVEDDSLVNPLIGVESCVRIRREWAVRVRPGQTGPPVPGDSDHRPNHSYLRLARLARRAATPAIAVGAVTDLRARSLLMPPSTLIEDVFGTSVENYRRGENRPLTSLREAINALLRGELPGTPDTPVAPAAQQDFMSNAFTVVGTDVVALWHSRRASNTNQVFVTRWPVGAPAQAATNAPIQVTPGPTAHASPSVVALPTGDVVVVYETAGQDVHARRGTPGTLATANEFQVATGATTDRTPFAVLAGDIVVFFWLQISGSVRTWQYRRWRISDGAFDGAAQQLSATNASAPSGNFGDFTAAADANGDIWASFRADDGSIRLIRFRPSTSSVDEQAMSAGTTNDQPFVLVDGTEAVWVFWRAGTDPNTSIAYQRVAQPAGAPGTWPISPPPTVVTGAAPARPTALRDADGAVWLFWSQLIGGSLRTIWLQRYLKSTNGWGAARQITGSTATDDQPFPIVGPDGVVLLFWLSGRTGNLDLFSRQFILAL